MSTAARRAPRSITDLSVTERKRLEDAHRRLRDAVARYEEFRGGALAPDAELPAHGTHAMAAAQAEVGLAEGELWHVREELLGWTRPSWAPNAALVADWFSDEDRIYDNAP